MFRLILVAVAALIGLLLLVPILGLRRPPAPFAPFPQSTPPLATVPLPAGLPAPVARFYQAVAGDKVPVIDSAVITGRGSVRLAGLTLPARLRFIHDAGRGYRHYIEATLFGYPLLKVNEAFLDGHARLALPFGVVADEPKIDAAASLGLWAESLWLSPLYLTDPRVRWQAIDDITARLIVPVIGQEGDEESFTVYFDPDTDLIRRLETMRYRDASDEAPILWQADNLEWANFHGLLIPSRSAATWADQGTPWLNVELEEVAYNVDVAGAIRAVGP